MAEGSSGSGEDGVNVVFGATITDLKDKLSEVMESIGKLKEAFAGITVALAGGELFKEAISSTNEMIDATRRMMSQTGMAADEAQAWSQALTDSDSSAESFTNTLLRMQQRINTNASAFAAYGISVRDSTGAMRPADEIFRSVIATLESMAPGANRNAVALQLLGRNARDIEPYIRATKASMDELKESQQALGLVVTDDSIHMKDAYAEMSTHSAMVFQGISKAIAETVVPGLISMGQAFIELGPTIVDATRDTAQTFLGIWENLKASIMIVVDLIVEGFMYLRATLVAVFGGESLTAMQVFRVALATVLSTFIGLRVGFEEIANVIHTNLEIMGSTIGAFAAATNRLLHLDFAGAKAIWKDAIDERNRILQEGMDKAVAIARAGGNQINAAMNGAFNDDNKPGQAAPAKPGGGDGHAKDLNAQKNAAALAKARQAIVKAEQQAELAIEKETTAEATQANEDAYKQRDITLDAYFSKKTTLLQADNAAEQRNLSAQIASAKVEMDKIPVGAQRLEMQAKLEELEGKLNVAKMQGLNIDKQMARARADEYESRAKAYDLEVSSNRVADVSGDIDAERNLNQQKLKDREITDAQLAQMELAWEDKLYAAQRANLKEQLSWVHDENDEEAKKLNDQLDQLDAQHNEKQLQNARAVANAENALRNTAVANIQSSFSETVSSLLNGTATIQQAFHKLTTSIGQQFSNLVAQKFAEKLFGKQSGFGTAIDGMIDTVQAGLEEMLGMQVSSEQARTLATSQGAIARVAIESWAAIKSVASTVWQVLAQIGAYAWAAAAGTYAAIADIPYVGPFLAPVMAVAAGAAVLAYAGRIASAEGGWWQVPNDTITNIHKDEMVLPSAEAKGLRQMIGGGGGSSGGTVHIHGSPNDSIKLKDLPMILKKLNRNFTFVG